MKHLFIYFKCILDKSLTRTGNEMSAFCGVAHYVQVYKRRHLKGMMIVQYSMMPQCHIEIMRSLCKNDHGAPI